jgi:hypothetical protein
LASVPSKSSITAFMTKTVSSVFLLVSWVNSFSNRNILCGNQSKPTKNLRNYSVTITFNGFSAGVSTVCSAFSKSASLNL